MLNCPQKIHIEKITALILTFNEELHIRRCLESLKGVADRIVVIDSGSTDNTTSICVSMGADVYYSKWVNYSSQFNWGLDNAKIKTDWVLRIDADEYLSDVAKESINKMMIHGISKCISGVYIKRIILFMGSAIRWGGCGRLYMLRLFRFSEGRCEERWMDEHIKLKTDNTIVVDGELYDDNKNTFGWWVNKHNNYATREAIDLLNLKYRFLSNSDRQTLAKGSQASRKRWIKENVYSRLPISLRCFLYFCWRYILMLGILDGTRGFLFHFMQGFWYRLLVDIKINEIESYSVKSNCSLPDSICHLYGYNLGNVTKNKL